MAAYLEFHVKGGGCLLVEAGSIAAVMAKGHDVWNVGTAEAPTLLILRGGETIEAIGVSAGGAIGRVVSSRKVAHDLKYRDGVEVYVDWLTPMGGPDAADSQPAGG